MSSKYDRYSGITEFMRKKNILTRRELKIYMVDICIRDFIFYIQRKPHRVNEVRSEYRFGLFFRGSDPVFFRGPGPEPVILTAGSGSYSLNIKSVLTLPGLPTTLLDHVVKMNIYAMLMVACTQAKLCL